MEKNEKMNRLQRGRVVRVYVTAAVFAVLTALLYGAAELFPAFVDTIYRPVSRTVTYGLAWAVGWIPTSVAEILLYLLILVAVAALIRLIWVLIRGPRRLRYLLHFAGWVLLLAALAAFLFVGIWGLNYRAGPLAAEMGLPAQPRYSEELSELNTYLAERANALAAQVEREADGSVKRVDFQTAAAAVAAEFGRTTGRREAPVKPILASIPLSYTQVTGIFIPFTAESNVNTNNVAYDLPFVMAHESAHRYAIAPEDEASFYAFYVLEDAEDPYLAYSVVMAALRSCQNALYRVDYDAFADVWALYSDAVAGDMHAYSEHWDQYEGEVAEVSEHVNNTYLVVQGVTDGVKSYGRMVDLMLAWYFSR